MDTLELLVNLGIEHDDTLDQVKMNRVNDVKGYFSQFDDGMRILNRVAHKIPRKERVDGLWEYMQARKKHDALKSEVETGEATMKEKKKELSDLKRILEDIE